HVVQAACVGPTPSPGPPAGSGGVGRLAHRNYTFTWLRRISYRIRRDLRDPFWPGLRRSWVDTFQYLCFCWRPIGLDFSDRDGLSRNLADWLWRRLSVLRTLRRRVLDRRSRDVRRLGRRPFALPLQRGRARNCRAGRFV